MHCHQGSGKLHALTFFLSTSSVVPTWPLSWSWVSLHGHFGWLGLGCPLGLLGLVLGLLGLLGFGGIRGLGFLCEILVPHASTWIVLPWAPTVGAIGDGPQLPEENPAGAWLPQGLGPGGLHGHLGCWLGVHWHGCKQTVGVALEASSRCWQQSGCHGDINFHGMPQWQQHGTIDVLPLGPSCVVDELPQRPWKKMMHCHANGLAEVSFYIALPQRQ